MDQEEVNLNIKINSTYLNDKRVDMVEEAIRRAIIDAVSKIDAKSAPVFIEITKVK